MSRLMSKPTKWPLRPAKTQISLATRPVWSASSLSAWRNIGSSATHRAHCEDSDQTGRTPRLIWVFAGCTDHFVEYVYVNLSRLTTKPTKWPLCPAKTQISLGICPVWSESSLSTWRSIGSSVIHWAHCKDSDQTGWMSRLIWVFAGPTDHFVGFVMR